MKRESFKSRLGFLLVSAGCAIGIGNVWRFPYVAGQNGGGIFVLFYLIFLVAMGLPVLTMELAVGRASRNSAVLGYKTLEKEGSKWHIHGWIAMFGCYMLMMYYTTVSGWMVSYFFQSILQSPAAHKKSEYYRKDHPECHLQGICKKISKCCCRVIRCHSGQKFTF